MISFLRSMYVLAVLGFVVWGIAVIPPFDGDNSNSLSRTVFFLGCIMIAFVRDVIWSLLESDAKE